MELKIVIPTHKRYDKIITHKIINTAIICPPESQYDAYKEKCKNHEIVPHPDNIIGLPKKKNWIYKTFKNVFMVDDDISSVRRNWTPNGQEITDSDLITDIINITAINASKCGCYMFGFSHNSRPTFYDGLSPVSLKGFITGCAVGLLEGSELMFEPAKESIVVKSAFYISLLNAYKHRKCYIDNRFYFLQEKTFVNSGGLAGYRNKQVEENSFPILKKYFGSAIKSKKNKIVGRNEFSCTINLPF
jgi:hypothetical protein